MKRPHVTVHVAQTLDGRLALDGKMTSLSTPEGRRCAHAARAASDAVLVGVNTVRIDDPRLTVREVACERAPLRVVLASALDVPRSSRVLGPGTIVVGARGRVDDARRAELEGAGAAVLVVDGGEHGVRLDEALDALSRRGIERLLVEGGARVLTSFFRDDLVDAVEIEIAMAFLGAPATPTLGGLDVDDLAFAPKLTNVSVDRLGDNVLVRGDVLRR